MANMLPITNPDQTRRALLSGLYVGMCGTIFITGPSRAVVLDNISQLLRNPAYASQRPHTARVFGPEDLGRLFPKS